MMSKQNRPDFLKWYLVWRVYDQSSLKVVDHLAPSFILGVGTHQPHMNHVPSNQSIKRWLLSPIVNQHSTLLGSNHVLFGGIKRSASAASNDQSGGIHTKCHTTIGIRFWKKLVDLESLNELNPVFVRGFSIPKIGANICLAKRHRDWQPHLPHKCDFGVNKCHPPSIYRLMSDAQQARDFRWYNLKMYAHLCRTRLVLPVGIRYHSIVWQHLQFRIGKYSSRKVSTGTRRSRNCNTRCCRWTMMTIRDVQSLYTGKRSWIESTNAGSLITVNVCVTSSSVVTDQSGLMSGSHGILYSLILISICQK